MRDIEKRQRVMARSMRLGHCVCDPRQGCPCTMLRERDVCLCAGERLEPPTGPVRLTAFSANPGCASKIDQAMLKRLLADLPPVTDPNVLVGLAAGDDAGVYRLAPDLALVQTVDVFTPPVDDPYTFGQIAAANSVSDIYAMGGRPITALSVVGFPTREAPDEALKALLRGGMEKMAEAGVAVIGGHSIQDPAVKAGFAVTGLIDPARLVTNAGARPGDALVLTKPLGTGILSFAAQIGRAPPGALDAAARHMAALNQTASELMLPAGAHAATDVTGFGLMGHLGELAAASRVDIELVWDRLPILPGVLACLAEGVVPGAVERNREASEWRIEAGPPVTPAMLDLCFDAQTSGGLLIALPAEAAPGFVARLHERGVSEAAVIGRVLGPGAGRIKVETSGERPMPEPTPAHPQPVSATPSDAAACCADGSPPPSVGEGQGGGARRADSPAPALFREFMKAAAAPGALDVATKEAIAIALSVFSKCEPCTRAHLKKAKEMGFSQAEIDEAAWLAVAFGGSPVMMFYNAMLAQQRDRSG
jgi:selenide,water dikinase